MYSTPQYKTNIANILVTVKFSRNIKYKLLKYKLYKNGVYDVTNNQKSVSYPLLACNIPESLANPLR